MKALRELFKALSEKRAKIMIGIGAGLIVFATAGLLITKTAEYPQGASDTGTGIEASPLSPQADATLPPNDWRNGANATPTQASAVVGRDILAIPTNTPFPTITPTGTPPVIEWSQAEKNALSWMCYGEVGGMQEVKVDACLSVISTVRARYAYYNGFDDVDVLSTLLRPGQFASEIRYDIPSPDPDMNWTVELYVSGVRGSCTGFLFFNSAPGGPRECYIESSNGQWIEFHNGY